MDAPLATIGALRASPVLALLFVHPAQEWLPCIRVVVQKCW